MGMDKGKDNNQDNGKVDHHISSSPFLLTSRIAKGVGAKKEWISSTQRLRTNGVKAEADWSLWKSLNHGSRKRSWVMLVTKLCLFKQETTRIIVTFTSFELEGVLFLRLLTFTNRMQSDGRAAASRKLCGGSIQHCSLQGFPRSLRRATLWWRDVTHDTPRNSPTTIRFHYVQFPITLWLDVVSFYKSITRLCALRLRVFSTAHVRFAEEC